MENAIKVFSNPKFGNVRVIVKDGEPLFCGKDVTTSLGYKDSVNALKQHCRGVAIYHPIEDSLGRKQEARFISEGDLYRLIAHSQLPDAERFESWVFDDVLPSIRKHGAYLTDSAAEALFNDPETFAKLAVKWANERKARLAAEHTVARQQEKIEADAPKVLFADSVSSSQTEILVGELAKILKQNGMDIGQNRLFKQLREDGYLVSRKGTDYNMPTQKSLELGLMRIKETTVTHADGHVTISKTPKVLGKGQVYFVNKYACRRLH